MSKPESHTLQAIDTPTVNGATIGRPTDYSPELGELICAKIASGKTLSEICRTKGLPARQTVLRWRREHPAFGVEYTRARVDQMEGWGDDCVEIADDDTLDTMQGVDKKGNPIEVANHANVQRDRLRIDTRKFLMSKIARHIYGEQVKHEHSGEVNQRHTVEFSDRERMRRLATFMVEDVRAGVTIEHEPGEPDVMQNPAMAGDVASPAASTASVKPAILSPADIIHGVNRSPLDETES